MMDKEQEARQLMIDAEKSVNSAKGFMSRLFGSSNTRLEESCEKYVRAGNMFKVGKHEVRRLNLEPTNDSVLLPFMQITKKWSEAGNAFEKSAEIQDQLKNKHESASNNVDAGNCYKKTDQEKAVKCINRAIDIYTESGRFTVAAKHHISIAEIYENDATKLDKAISHYEQAADFYKGEESTSSANKCLLKVAAYAAQLEQYVKAIDLYERVGMNSMDSPLLKYSVKEYFFKAALCNFCLGGPVDAEQSLERYVALFPAFADSREYQLLQKLIQAFNDQCADTYSEAVAHYDQISRIDQWLTTILLRIKKSIHSEFEELT